jgi:2-polyprenyl-3-methyl-5-hydroxy-6-metoxy-1,4-benzoquinol methylase
MSSLHKKIIPKIARRMSIPYSIWLSALEKSNSFYSISQERRFEHDEYSYDSQYENAIDFSSGKGLTNLLKRNNANPNKPLLEIGCGTGLLSAGLIKEGYFKKYMITDPSSAFLSISQKKIHDSGVSLQNTDFAILNADDMIALPRNMFSVIAIRATLHHITDVKRFVQYSAKALSGNGILVFQEPCREGYILMGVMAQFFPIILEKKSIKISDKQKEQIQLFIDTMKFYARRDIDKSVAEDKHLFKVDEITSMATEFGLKTEFYPNTNFENFNEANHKLSQDYFKKFYIDYLKYCMSFDSELLNLFEEHFVEFCTFIEDISGNNGCPYLDGVFVCQKK